MDVALQADPDAGTRLDDAALDAALEVVADFVDLKSRYTAGHSRTVSSLAAEAARHCSLPADDVALVRHAGYVHDLGRVAVSVNVWDRPGRLTRDSVERVRLHPYHTERVLSACKALAAIGRVARLHHERLDASGYHRGIGGPGLPVSARLLAAADAYAAMTQDRVHRPALAADRAAGTLRSDVRPGRLDGEAVEAVLAAAGHRPLRVSRIAGLSPREVDVLRLLAGGLTTQALARRLGLSPKTADAHIQHIYTKVGVRTRAAATLFALEKGLVSPE